MHDPCGALNSSDSSSLSQMLPILARFTIDANVYSNIANGVKVVQNDQYAIAQAIAAAVMVKQLLTMNVTTLLDAVTYTIDFLNSPDLNTRYPTNPVVTLI